MTQIFDYSATATNTSQSDDYVRLEILVKKKEGLFGDVFCKRVKVHLSVGDHLDNLTPVSPIPFVSDPRWLCSQGTKVLDSQTNGGTNQNVSYLTYIFDEVNEGKNPIPNDEKFTIGFLIEKTRINNIQSDKVKIPVTELSKVGTGKDFSEAMSVLGKSMITLNNFCPVILDLYATKNDSSNTLSTHFDSGEPIKLHWKGDFVEEYELFVGNRRVKKVNSTIISYTLKEGQFLERNTTITLKATSYIGTEAISTYQSISLTVTYAKLRIHAKGGEGIKIGGSEAGDTELSFAISKKKRGHGTIRSISGHGEGEGALDIQPFGDVVKVGRQTAGKAPLEVHNEELVSHAKLRIHSQDGEGVKIGSSNPEHTELSFSISKKKEGYGSIESISSAGTKYGELEIQPHGDVVKIGKQTASKAPLEVHNESVVAHSKLSIHAKGGEGIKIGGSGVGDTELCFAISKEKRGHGTIRSISGYGEREGGLEIQPFGDVVKIGKQTASKAPLEVHNESVITHKNTEINAGLSVTEGVTVSSNVGIGTSTPQDRLHINHAGKGGVTIGDMNTNGTYMTLGAYKEAGNGNGFIQCLLRGIGGGDLNLNPEGGDVKVHGDLWVLHPNHVKNPDKNDNALLGWCRLSHEVGGDYWKKAEWRMSDAQLKHNITPLSSSLEHILSLNAVSFQWNDQGMDQCTKDVEANTLSSTNTPEDNAEVWELEKQRIREENGGVHLGFIAQEIEQVFPTWVKENEDGFKTINTDELLPVLVGAIQQQQAMIKENTRLIEEQRQLLEKLSQSV